MSNVHKVILVGVGGFGAEWWSAIEEAGLAVSGLVDPDKEALETAAAHFHVPSSRCFTSDPAPWLSLPADFVIDSSPARFHYQHALLAVQHGLDVLVVKPMAEQLSNAIEMVQAAQQYKRKLMVAQQKRFLPGFLKVRELVLSNRLGRLGNVHVDLNVNGIVWEPGVEWRRQMAYPLLLDGSIHHFDLMRWVLGREPVSILADSFNTPWSDFVGDACLAAFVEMTGGLHVHYRASWSPRGSELITFFSGWQLEFDQGCVILRDGEVFVNGDSMRCLPDDGNPALSLLNSEVLRYFLGSPDCTEARGLSGTSNLTSVAMMCACLQSIEMGRKIFIRHPDTLEVALAI